MNSTHELVRGMGALRIDTPPETSAKAVVLVLHGGTDRSHTQVRPRSGAVLRMVPFARRLESLGTNSGVVVARLVFQIRGWNGSKQSPVHDARWALAELAHRFPEVPVGLIGHSMGGRTVLAVAGEANVRSVVALAPWVPNYDSAGPVRGRRLLVMHGENDGLTSPAESADYVVRARPLTQSASYVNIRKERHPMLLRAGVWHVLATAFTLSALAEPAGFSVPPNSFLGGAAKNEALRRTLASALAGEDAEL